MLTKCRDIDIDAKSSKQVIYTLIFCKKKSLKSTLVLNHWMVI